MLAWLLSKMAGSVVGTIFSGIMEPVNAYLAAKYENKKIEVETAARIQVAQTNAEIRRIDADIDADAELTRQMEHSWKDEFWTILLAFPVVLVFIPGMQDHILTGFNNLNEVPDWYKIALGLAIGTAFGYRKMVNVIGAWQGKKAE